MLMINTCQILLFKRLPQQLLSRLASQFKDPVERECCVDGMRTTLLSYTCERRSEYIGDDRACVRAFLHCCKAMENQQAESKEDNLQLARSKGLGQGDDRLKYIFGVSNNTFPL